MSGLAYLAAALILGGVFMRHAIALRREDAPANLPMTVFRYSIRYLMLLFAALLIDHYLPRWP
jgi:protoheme IX farnesyltransferase